MKDSIQAVKKRHETRLLQLPGVVAVGIGLDRNGQPAIIVGLDGPNHETEAVIPTRLEGYRVVVRVVGAIKAH